MQLQFASVSMAGAIQIVLVCRVCMRMESIRSTSCLRARWIYKKPGTAAVHSLISSEAFVKRAAMKMTALVRADQ